MPHAKKTDVPILVQSPYFEYVADTDNGTKTNPRLFHDYIMSHIVDDNFISFICPYFFRSMTRNSCAWFGGPNPLQYKRELNGRERGRRIHVKLSYEDMDIIGPVECAMNVPMNHLLEFIVVKGVEFDRKQISSISDNTIANMI